MLILKHLTRKLIL